MTLEELQQAISDQKDLMVAVATGGPRIQEKNDEYQRRRRGIRAGLAERGLEDPNAHRDLWAWYGHWSTDLPTYAARRQYVSDTYGPLLDALENLEERTIGSDLQPRETGWTRVDKQLAQLRERYAAAESAEDFQAVGLLCRELLRSLADQTFEEALVPERRVVPGPADAVARLGYVVAAYVPGPGGREIRKMLKAHLDLANSVQHDRDATLLDATMVAESSITTVTLIRALVLGPGEIAEEQSPDFAQHATAAAQMYSMLLDSEAVDAIKDIGGVPAPSLVIENETFDDFATKVVGKPWRVGDNYDFDISSSGEIDGYKHRRCAADYNRLRDDLLAVMAEAGLSVDDLARQESALQAGRRLGETEAGQAF